MHHYETKSSCGSRLEDINNITFHLHIETSEQYENTKIQ